MAVLQIGGNTVPAPSVLYVVISDIKTEERNAAGSSVIDTIAAGKRRLECDWSYVTNANLATLLGAVSGATFTVSYLDPLINTAKTITCTVGERSIGALMYKSGTPVWGNVKMTFTEQ